MKSFVLLLLLLVSFNAHTQHLVKDINLDSRPQDLILPTDDNQKPINIGNTVFFVANDGISGMELWKTNGTAMGTQLVRDIYPGTDDANPRYLTEMNGQLYFAANDGVHGSELWKSDGTAEGTVMVKNIMPSNGHSLPAYLVNNNGTLYFRAAGESNVSYLPDQELWKSDGTALGTVLVKNLNELFSSEPRTLTVFNNEVYFAAKDNGATNYLWKTNGTEAGTVKLSNTIVLGGEMVASGNFLYFTALVPSFGNELCKTDGVTTEMVKDINPSSAESLPAWLTDVNGTLFFTAANGNNNSREVWKSDGTEAGTVILKDIYASNIQNFPPEHLVNVNGTLFFTAFEDATGRELWKSDGTAAGTQLVKDIYTGSAPNTHLNLTNIFGTLYFSGTTNSSAQELWKSDGTEPGTFQVKDINPANGLSHPSFLTPLQIAGVPSLIFFADNNSNGREMWVSNGTDAGTNIVKNINPENGDASREASQKYYAFSNGNVFFSASNYTQGVELWKSDGTEAGTILLKDIVAGFNDGSPRFLTNLSGFIYFSASNNLWRTDGTPAGTVIVKAGVAISNLIAHNGLLYFSGSDGTSGSELWKSDGTEAGTTMVKDIAAGSNKSSSPENFNRVGSLLLFVANDGVNGKQLWRSDGTEAGTVRIVPAVAMTPMSQFTASGSLLYFTAYNSTTDEELWRSDGTDAGTYMVKNIQPDGAGVRRSSFPKYLTSFGNGILFQAESGFGDGTAGFEIWRSDGSELGTEMVKDINSTPTSVTPRVLGGSYPSQFTGAGNLAYFYAYTPGNGRELWRTDGTSAGTLIVSDAEAGSQSGVPDQFINPQAFNAYKPAAINNSVYYPSGTAATGIELYRADGMGAALVAEGIVGTRGSIPQSLFAADDELYYFNDDGEHGRELWHYDPAVNYSLPVDSGTAVININEKNTAYTEGGELIAHVKQTGLAPLNHQVQVKVKVHATIQTYNGQQYAGRHYDIEPAWNPNNSTGLVTLYFTQAEFNAYNTFNNSTLDDLPKDNNDVEGKSRLRITQYHGSGSQPGNYTGASEVIDPADNNIVWNSSQNHWEITFAVTGFSGFYITSVASTLPVTLVRFNVKANTCKADLTWETLSEVNSSRYQIEYSTNGTSFTTAGEVSSKNTGTGASYSFTHSHPASGTGFYRLRMIDKDNTFAFSDIRKINLNCSNITIAPNPVSTAITITGLANKTEVVIYDASGQLMYRLTTTGASVKIPVAHYAKGTYLVNVVKDRAVIVSQRVVKL